MTSKTDEDLAYLVSFASLSHARPRDIEAIRAAYGSLAAGWSKSGSDLAKAGASPNLGADQRSTRSIEYAETVVSTCRRESIAILDYWNSVYPSELRRLDNPPLVIYVRGVMPQGHAAIAIVGTREPTEFGVRSAQEVAKGAVTSGCVVVSGLARGIDSAAHQAALDEGGQTFAVLPSGHLNIYPVINRALANRIVANGALISEYPPGFGVKEWSLRNRNRIIAALAKAVVVIEAREHSGAFITVRFARDLDIPVYVVTPADPSVPQAAGPNQLLSTGVATPLSDLRAIPGLSTSEGRVHSWDDLERANPSLDATTATSEHHLARLLLDAIAWYIRENQLDTRFLTRTKLEKWTHAVAESLDLPLTRSWYLRGCYVQDESLTLTSLQERVVNSDRLTSAVTLNLRHEVERVARETRIWYTPEESYLRWLYQHVAPAEFRSIYLANLRTTEQVTELQDFLRLRGHGGSNTALDQWADIGTTFGQRMNESMSRLLADLAKDQTFDNVYEVFQSYCLLIGAASDTIDAASTVRGTKWSELRAAVEPLTNSYYSAIWRLPASLISAKTVKGPGAERHSKQMIESARDLVVELAAQYPANVARYIAVRDAMPPSAH